MTEEPTFPESADELPPVDEGALLYVQGPGDPEDLFDLPEEEEAPSRGPLIVGGVAVLAVLGFFLFRPAADTVEIDESASLPEMVESEIATSTTSNTLTALPSDSLRGDAGSTLFLAVRAVGGGGAILTDTLVVFSVTAGEAELDATEIRTNENGIATTSVTLPPAPGLAEIAVAASDDLITPVKFTIEVVPGPPVRISRVSGNGQAAEVGQLLADRLFVGVADALGNPVPGVDVRFRIDEGEGLTAPSQTTTDSLGEASALWRLGMVEGEQTLMAFSPTFGGGVTFRANATPGDTPLGPSALETAPVTVTPERVAIGGSHACELSGPRLSCRGADDRGQARSQGVTAFVAISAGVSHMCGLTDEGLASCWGANERGQLGDGTRSDKDAPVGVRTELRFSTLVAGTAHTCGLAGSGVPICWGVNLSGQLGDGTRNDQTLPRTVGGGLAFESLAAGWSHTCGLSSNGNAFCWGLNSNGQLGDGSRLDRLVPTLVRGAVQSLVAGSAHTCGISVGEVLCWGANAFGQVGDGSSEDRLSPVPVEGISSAAVALTAGAVHTCTLLSDGQAVCWGQNLHGQLGDGTTINRSTPVPVSGGLRFSELHAGGAQTCGITTNGDRFCWGLNSNGQLGDGSRTSQSRPTRVIG